MAELPHLCNTVSQSRQKSCLNAQSVTNVDNLQYVMLNIGWLLCLLLYRFIKDDYLQQNSYTKYDKYCPFYKSVEMMRNIVTFHRLATAAVERTASGNAEGQKITLNVVKQRMSDVLYKLTSQKFEDPGGCCFGC